jgi:methionyl-tRNA formyltransferase
MGNHRIGLDIKRFLEVRGNEFVWSTIMGSPLSADHSIAESEPDIGISILYPHIIPTTTISLFPRGIINLHPALLPYCRGKYPALWAILDRKPAGVTLHYIDEGVDTGDIIAQQHVPYDNSTVCRDLYERCARAGYWMFVRAWDSIVRGSPRRIPQPHHKATFHLGKELPDPDKWFGMTAKEIQDQYGR